MRNEMLDKMRDALLVDLTTGERFTWRDLAVHAAVVAALAVNILALIVVVGPGR